MLPARTTHAWATISSANYLAYVKTLYQSLRRCDPAAAENFYLILADDPLPASVEKSLPFKVINAEDLGIPEIWDMAIRYSVLEFNTAIKPAALTHLMDLGYSRVTYLDPDMVIYKPLTHVGELHNAGHDLILTPHSTDPLCDGKDPDDFRLLRTGAYNLGFVSCQDTPSTRRLLDWWHGHLVENCRVDLENGIFVDQKFMDLAPSYGENVHVLRHSGYNVAYWNLMSREIRSENGTWKAGNEDLHCFHFSGVRPGNRKVLSIHQDRFDSSNIGELDILLSGYLDQLEANGHSDLSKRPYAFARFANGTSVPDIYRSVYANLNRSAAIARRQAFHPDYSTLDEPDESVEQYDFPVTRVMMAIWKRRADLRDTFCISDKRGREAFCRWFVSAADREYKLPPIAYASVSQSLNALDSLVASSAKSRTARWLMNSALGENSLLRKVYRGLPHTARAAIRGVVVRASCGHSPAGAQVSPHPVLNRSLRPGFGVIGYLSAISGVGEGARRMTDAVRTADIDSSLHLLDAYGHPNVATQADIGPAEEASPYNTLLFHVNADETPHVLDSLPASVLRGRYRIGYWAWELPALPEAFVPSLDYLNEIWVPSVFVQRAIQSRTNKPVHVVPHVVPEAPDSGESRLSFGLPANNFLFLCACDLKSFVARKNPLAAYEAFCRAFPEGYREDGPRLVMKVISGPEQTDTLRNLTNLLSQDKRVIFMDVALSNERYTALQRLCDAYVSLHRSEGFGLNIAECMLKAKPVIATAYSGNSDFLKEAFGYPVDYNLVPVKSGEYPHADGQVWANPSVDHAAELMQRVVANPAEARRKGRAARDHIQRNYSADNVAKILSAHFNRIQEAGFASKGLIHVPAAVAEDASLEPVATIG